MGKKILLGLVLLFVAIQFIRPAKNLSAAPPGKDDVAVRFGAPPAVRHMLETACYDCHSNNTRYPWYAEVQPVGWWLASHVADAKENLNFSELGALDAKAQGKRFGRIADVLSDGSMPLPSYTWIHRDAKLTPAQITTLVEWAEALQEKVEAGP